MGGDRLVWALRRYAWVVLTCTVLGGGLALSFASSPPTSYEATSVVVAKRLAVSPLSLPRFGAVVFEAGAVARAVIGKEALHLSPDRLIPAKISMQPVQGTILFQVTARDPSAQSAARLANVAADAFVVELNRPGVGVGIFAVQQRALVPTVPTAELSLVLATLIGATAGAIAGMGVVGLFLVMGQPVTERASAERLVGVPVLASIVLPRRMGAMPNSYEVGRLKSLASRVFEGDLDRHVLLCGATDRVRITIALLLAEVASRGGGEVIVAAEAGKASEIRAISRRADQETRVEGEALIELMIERDIIHLRRTGTGTGHPGPGAASEQRIFLVMEGATAKRVSSALDELQEEPHFAVLVRQRRRRRLRERVMRLIRGRRSSAPVSQAPNEGQQDRPLASNQAVRVIDP